MHLKLEVDCFRFKSAEDGCVTTVLWIACGCAVQRRCTDGGHNLL